MNVESFLRLLGAYGVNAEDKDLRRLCFDCMNVNQDTERLINAGASLIEASQQNRLKHPTAFMKSAINSGYLPHNSLYCYLFNRVTQ
jgi:hypothetical protein